jgi:prepilin-type N-terminal cleavage/methylation domain-containing protein
MKVRRNGFTLIELMLVVTIIILMAGMAVPLLTQMSGSSRTDNAATQVQAMILMARQQAVQYHTETSVMFLQPNVSTGAIAHPYTRMILGQSTTPGSGNFAAVPGSYAIDLPNGIQVANGANPPVTQFAIAFSTAGTVHPKTSSANTVLDIGPITGTGSMEKTVEYRLNRVTGGFLQLTDREVTH